MLRIGVLLAILLISIVGTLSTATLELDQILAEYAAKSHAVNTVIPKFQTFYVDQKIDNFDFTKSATYAQRNLYTTEFYNPKNKDAPLFVYTGGEAEVTWYWENAGHVFNMARELGAAILFVEHRYYGESMPMGKNLTREKLRYLSMTQAMADFAHTISYAKEAIFKNPNMKAIAFGGSYAGMLAGWMRLKYPHLIEGAVASSAPYVFAYQTDAEDTYTYQYFKTVTDDYAAVNSACPSIVRAAFSQLEQLERRADFPTIQRKLNLCSTPTNSSDVDYIRLWVRQGLLSMAQVDYPYASGTNPALLQSLPAWPVKVACQALLETPGDNLDKLRNAVSVFYAAFDDLKARSPASRMQSLHRSANAEADCFDYRTQFIECGDRTGCGDGDDGLAWDYQVCTEFADFSSSNNVTDMFPPELWDAKRHREYCLMRWGVHTNFNYVRETFGGVDWTGTSNVLLTNGLLDPWYGGGILASQADDVLAILIRDAAHHLDLNTPCNNDPEHVVQARSYITRAVQAFLMPKSDQRARVLASLRAEADKVFPNPKQ